MTDEYKKFFRKAGEVRRDPRDEDKLRRALRPRRKKPPFPWQAAAGLAVSVVVAGAYLAFPRAFESLLERIDVSAVAHVAAENAAPAAADPAKAAAKTGASDPDKGPVVKTPVAEDISHFEKLRARKEELDLREKELVELEEELQRQKVELDKRIQQLEAMRSQIAQVLKDRVEVDQEKVGKLVDLYSNMKPKQAAEILGSINEELAVEVLAKMKKKNAAEIMNLLPPEKAKVLSEKYTGYRRGRPEPKG